MKKKILDKLEQFGFQILGDKTVEVTDQGHLFRITAFHPNQFRVCLVESHNKGRCLCHLYLFKSESRRQRDSWFVNEMPFCGKFSIDIENQDDLFMILEKVANGYFTDKGEYDGNI